MADRDIQKSQQLLKRLEEVNEFSEQSLVSSECHFCESKRHLDSYLSSP